MFDGQQVIVVMPAYNAEQTLRTTHSEVMAQRVVDRVIVVDDASADQTVTVARSLPKTDVYTHPENLGYGANQKFCYRKALEAGGDIIIMVHPDYQYTPKLIPAMAALIGCGLYDCVLGSRILGGYALEGGMPLWKYVANRFLTLVENLMLGTKLSEFHTGYRAYSGRLLQQLPFEDNSNDFLFDNQILAQVLWFGYRIAEVSCPTRYFPEASTINFPRSIRYGIGCLITGMRYRMAQMNILQSRLFPGRDV